MRNAVRALGNTTTHRLVGGERHLGARVDGNVGEELVELEGDWLRVHGVLVELERVVETEQQLSCAAIRQILLHSQQVNLNRELRTHTRDV